MKIFNKKDTLISYLSVTKSKKETVGFIPTMGALHQGHLSLIKKAQQENDMVVVSIFVNPTQFNNKKDVKKYPKTIEKDTLLLENISCDVLFLPSIKDIYAQNVVSKKFDFNGLEHQMEGKYREGHFDGVGTVVKKLFEIINPKNAYFGEKDFQQLQIVKKMVEKQHLSVKIKTGKIYREKDGLAMSSRNVHLTKEQREIVPFIFATLKKVKEKFGTENVEKISKWVEKEFKKEPLLALEYFIIADEKTLRGITQKEQKTKYRAFIAVFAGTIRLIDNISL